MALNSLSNLLLYKGSPVTPGYPVEEAITFYRAFDDADGAMNELVRSAAKSLVLVMTNLENETLTSCLLSKMEDPLVYVSLTLGVNAWAGKHHQAIRAAGKLPSNSFATGHFTCELRDIVVDSLDTLSDDGQKLTVIRHPIVAAEARDRINLVHEGFRTAADVELNKALQEFASARMDIMRTRWAPPVRPLRADALDENPDDTDV